MDRASLCIPYVHYGEQSGVTAQVSRSLEALGHRVLPVSGHGPLELRDAATRRPRLTPLVLAHLALAAARFGSRALSYRWNTPFAFDVHSRCAGERITGLRVRPDIVLQNGALFAPGAPPSLPYVLLLDHTRALAERMPGVPQAGLPAPSRWGRGWRRREAALYRGAAAVATFSECAARSVIGDYGVDRDRVRVVGAGPNVLPSAVRREDDGETILFVGRDFDRKGGPILLDAFARLRRRRPSARLLVAGPPQRLGLPPGAEQLGPVPESRLEDLFARATVFALPSLREPFGIAFLDAMACGVPCVGTLLEAMPEIVDDGLTGLLVPPADAAALAEVLERLLAAPSRARRMGELGRARVLARFTWALVAQRLSGLLLASVRKAHTARLPPAWDTRATRSLSRSEH
jgi:glycosyltransferase involved in cell wall biosynthesis